MQSEFETNDSNPYADFDFLAEQIAGGEQFDYETVRDVLAAAGRRMYNLVTAVESRISDRVRAELRDICEQAGVEFEPEQKSEYRFAGQVPPRTNYKVIHAGAVIGEGYSEHGGFEIKAEMPPGSHEVSVEVTDKDGDFVGSGACEFTVE